MSEHNFEFEKQQRDDYWQIVIAHDEGKLNAVLDFEGAFAITSLYVEQGFRRRGLGTALLEEAKLHAELEQADIVWADIRSREEILVYQRVFGNERVSVKELGSFSSRLVHKRDAKAFLEYSPILEQE